MIENLLKEILKEIREIKLDVSSLKSDVSSLKSDVISLKLDVSTLKSDVGIMKQDIEILKSQVDENTRILRSLEFVSEINKSEHDAIKHDVSKLFGEAQKVKEVAKFAYKMLA
jgi:chromosome segregation ATPase